MLKHLHLAALTAACVVPAGHSPAAGGETIPSPAPEPESILRNHFDITLDSRARFEYVDTAGLEEAWALTLRNRIGLLVHDIGPFSGFAEYEGTLPAERRSANFLSHGDANKSVIPDPGSHELNQAWGQFSDQGLTIKAGRQRIILDNARFVGNVGWRQNEQTFDAASVTWTGIEDLTLYYAYLWRVNRIFGSENSAPPRSDFEGASHLVNVSWKGLPHTNLTAYAYLLDLHNGAGDANSCNSFGLRIDGALPGGTPLKFPYLLEYAWQTDAFGSPLDYSASYLHAALAADAGKFSVGAGFETLFADNGVGFKTPLATAHAFNGFNDVFLDTPPGGLQDLYVHGSVDLPWDLKLAAWFHWFGDDSGSFDYGTEADATLAKKLTDHLSLIGKFARYQADSFGADEQLYSIELNIKF